jgi:hypothetical protein
MADNPLRSSLCRFTDDLGELSVVVVWLLMQELNSQLYLNLTKPGFYLF